MPKPFKAYVQHLIYLLKNTFRKKTANNIIGENIDIVNKGILSGLEFDIRGKNIQIKIGQNTKFVKSKVQIWGNNIHLSIGENCLIENTTFWFEDNNGKMILGDFTTIGSGLLAVVEDNSVIEIGNDCMLSNNIEIRTSDSHAVYDLVSGNRINAAKSIIIEDHVWIGAHCKILKGVRISKNSVIALGSVVTKNVDANSIYGGIPATLIRAGVGWHRDRNTIQ